MALSVARCAVVVIVVIIMSSLSLYRCCCGICDRLKTFKASDQTLPAHAVLAQPMPRMITAGSPSTDSNINTRPNIVPKCYFIVVVIVVVLLMY